MTSEKGLKANCDSPEKHSEKQPLLDQNEFYIFTTSANNYIIIKCV